MVVVDPRRPRPAGHLARPRLYGAVAALIALLTGTAQAARLEVVVANVRSGKGHVRVAVCTAETFLKASCERNSEVRSAPGEVMVTLEVPPGAWAVQAYLDEDDSKRIPRNFLGIPTTGLGFSNDAPFRFGPPTFADAAFRLEPGGTRIRLTLRYF